jgi:phage gp29-like protein
MATVNVKNLNTELLLGAMATNAWLTFLGDYLRSLPRYVDDAERDFGIDLYERMLRDPGLASAIGALKTATLSQGPRFTCRVDAPSPAMPDPEKQAIHEQAEEIRGFVERMMDRLQQPLEDILFEMLDFLAFGHKVAEEVYELQGGRLMLSKLRVKPRASYAFVVDQYMNLLGLAATSATGLMLDSSAISPEQVISREKFFILTNDAKGGDPRGSSALRPAYNPWYLKQQAWPMYLKFLAQFGTPSIWGKLPPNAEDKEVINADGAQQRDADGNPIVMTAADAMLAKLIAFANGTAIVVDDGTELNIIEPKTDGEAYIKAFDLFDRQMTKAVLISVRATMEAEHGSKADSATAQDILAEIVQGIRRKVEIAFFRDVISPVVRYNFGDEAADGSLCPIMTLSDVPQQDQVAYGDMIANLGRANLLHLSQYPGIDAKLGLPQRDFSAQQIEIADQKDQEAAAQLEMSKLLNPVGDRAISAEAP